MTSPSSSKPDDIQLFETQRKIYPQSISGTFRTAKWALMVFCLGIYYFLPFLRWNRGVNLPDQAVLIDFPGKKFYFFFIEIWPQEFYYITGLLVVASFVLFLTNALAGRVWCGYLCPQTVWTDLFYAVERRIEGDRREQMIKDKSPLTLRRLGKKTLKHLIWLLISWWTGGAWVLYFADAPTLVWNLLTFTASPIAYTWILILTGTTYIMAGYAREQVCLYMCPWPRIQAALTDEDAFNVSYRTDRGEPRMSLKAAETQRKAGEPAGDCIDCNQCVAVCPTGVDIRNGSDMGCIQCGLCIDACDAVMKKVGRAPRLIAYDTDKNIRNRAAGLPEEFRPLRARTLIYTALIIACSGLMLWQLATRSFTYLGVIHDRNPLFVSLSDGSVRNAYTLNLSNKSNHVRIYELSIEGIQGLKLDVVGEPPTSGMMRLTAPGGESRQFRVLLTAPNILKLAASTPIRFRVTVQENGEQVQQMDSFKAP